MNEAYVVLELPSSPHSVELKQKLSSREIKVYEESQPRRSVLDVITCAATTLASLATILEVVSSFAQSRDKEIRLKVGKTSVRISSKGMSSREIEAVLSKSKEVISMK